MVQRFYGLFDLMVCVVVVVECNHLIDKDKPNNWFTSGVVLNPWQQGPMYMGC